MSSAPSASTGRSAGTQFSKGFDITPQAFQDIRGPLRDVFLSLIPQFEGALDFEAPTGAGLDAFRTPLSSQEFRGIDRLESQAEGLSEGERLSQDLLNRRLRGDFFAPGENEALQNVIRFTTGGINRAFDEQDLERRSLFARAGQSLPESSPFAQAQATGNVGRAEAIGGFTSDILLQNLQAERERQTAAIEQTRANSRGVFERSQAALQASALPRLVDELGVDRGLQVFTSRLSAITNALGLAGGLAAPTVANQSSGQQSSKNVGAGL